MKRLLLISLMAFTAMVMIAQESNQMTVITGELRELCQPEKLIKVSFDYSKANLNGKHQNEYLSGSLSSEMSSWASDTKKVEKSFTTKWNKNNEGIASVQTELDTPDFLIDVKFTDIIAAGMDSETGVIVSGTVDVSSSRSGALLARISFENVEGASAHAINMAMKRSKTYEKLAMKLLSLVKGQE